MHEIPTTMRAIAIENPGRETGELSLIETKTPTPAAHEILIRVEYAGVNRADILQRKGLYPAPENASPLPGLEVSGIIVAIGSDVTQWKIGDAVCALLSGGGYAEYATADAGQALRIPTGWNMAEAAALPEALFTVWMALQDAAEIKSSDTLLVHGGASGIGMIALQYARALGVKTFATASSKEKCDACQSFGATRAINYTQEDFVSVIANETKNSGVKIILDMIGGDYIERNFSALAIDGKLISIASLRGTKIENFSLAPLLLKRITWKGVTLRSRSSEQKNKWCQDIATALWPLLESGSIRPKIDHIYTYAHSKKSHIRMENNLNIGKIVLQLI